jgi:hypothetical protein
MPSAYIQIKFPEEKGMGWGKNGQFPRGQQRGKYGGIILSSLKEVRRHM